MDTSFTSKQREILARKLGYDGPMQGFDDFLQSSPALMMKYNAVTDKYAKRMAKGGSVTGYAEGGLTMTTEMPPGEDSPRSIWRDAQGNAYGEAQVAQNADGSWRLKSAPAPAPTPAPASAPAVMSEQQTQTTAPAPAPETAVNIPPAGFFGDVGPPTPAPAPPAPAPAPTPGVTGGGGVTFEETQGRTGTPMPGAAAGFTPVTTPTTPGQDITGVGGAGTASQATTTQVGGAAQATTPQTITATTAEATQAAGGVKTALEGVTPAQGTVGEQAQVKPAEGVVSPGSLATAATMGQQYIAPVTAEQRTTEAGELVTAETEASAPEVKEAQTTMPAGIQAAQGAVRPEELPKPAQIKDADMAQAEAITASGLAPDAIAVAARLEKFTVDNETLAQAAQGNVDAQSTVQGQLTQLMKSFDDGATPAWAAGAIRAANAAMAARGLGGSSMAGAAIFQAAMESALPIAQQDAQVFQQMGITNLNNRQQVALANAAAQQGLQLQNLNNEQQAALQNSANSFALQSQNLSNMQQTMVANAQIRASLQAQNLSNQQQANLAEAARYAEMANINLNNIQQARLQDSVNAVQVDLANLSTRQQSYVVNAQLQASLQGQNLSNKQQSAVLNAARIAENNNISFNAAQQAQLHNSTLMQTIGIAELNAQQSTVLANAATLAGMDMANLNNRQQAAVVNAQAFLQMDMTNLDRDQQATLFKGQQMVQALLSDTAAENAMKQFNASSKTQVDQFMVTMASQVSQFNAAQKNAIDQFNTDQVNAVSKFNAEQTNARDNFNAQQRLIIDQSNAQWRREVSTADTAAANAALYLGAQNLQQMTLAEYNNETQLYRDQLEKAWSSFEKNEDRRADILKAEIGGAAAEDAAEAGLWGSIVGGLMKL